MRGRSIYQKNITLINIHAPNIEATKYITQKQTELKGEINTNTVTAGDVNNSSQLWIDNPNRELIRKQQF